MSVEQDVQETIDELESTETVTEEDLEAAAESFPTDPLLAKLVKKALPPPWDEVFEYVNDGRRRYWRTKHARDTEGERRSQEAFAEAAAEAEGLTGTVEYEGKEIPASAAYAAEKMKGSGDGGTPTRGRRALSRLRSVLGLDT